ncbi:Druantia anti-phage system protein DruA [Caldisericum sp.]|uniref:Druantia anti-phage system protein DruA n=1 Tax=Caldisericum sp. TaxID=2499687 RepID=UPI003D0F96F7
MGSKTLLSVELIGEIRNKVNEILKSQGFSLIDGKLSSLSDNKDFIRKQHSFAVKYILDANIGFIKKVDNQFTSKYIIDGKELDLASIDPELVSVSNDEQGNLFKWIKLHWSIPISAGYGRRLRYIVYDRGNSAVIGIIGLADPVFAIKDRDRLIGWDYETRKRNLKHVMDAFVLGAVPPYSMLLGGKLVASLAASTKVINDFRKKYEGRKALISGEVFDGKLAAITTTSALGKSSLYDRIKIPNGPQYIHAGWSSGSGDFHFLNGVYDQIFEFAKESASLSKNPKWGNGVRNRRAVLRAAFKQLGLPDTLLYHNVRRELFVVPLGRKSFEFLRDESLQIQYYKLNVDEISSYALKRWVIPRAERNKSYLNFKKEQYSLLSISKENEEGYS